MDFSEWEPIYEAILTDFGYGRGGDEDARGELRRVAEPFDPARIDCSGQHVAIAGDGPSLLEETDRATTADRVFAASSAGARLADAGVSVDLLVTDLDGTPDTARRRTTRDEPVAVHAHGDNRDLLAEWLPSFEMDAVLATTQAAPAEPVVNHGGFTDGDRAAYLADAMGADRIRFVGWDFDDPTVSPEKTRKLDWAERLLALLERRRGEQFPLLDGRRDEIDPIDV